jgi:predicted membrane channel-forming protein YqfA (hemolysin III family)
MGLSAIFPVLHGLELHGIDEMQDRIGLTWLVLQGFLYILGAGLYAVSSPSLLNRMSLISLGSLARTFMAGLFRYLGKFASDLPCACCYGCCITFIRLAKSIRLPPRCARLEMLDLLDSRPKTNTIQFRDLGYYLDQHISSRNQIDSHIESCMIAS